MERTCAFLTHAADWEARQAPDQGEIADPERCYAQTSDILTVSMGAHRNTMFQWGMCSLDSRWQFGGFKFAVGHSFNRASHVFPVLPM